MEGGWGVNIFTCLAVGENAIHDKIIYIKEKKNKIIKNQI
jgi:hypothetical protein